MSAGSHRASVIPVANSPSPIHCVVVVGVRADPEPDDVLSLANAEGSVLNPDPHGEYGASGMNLLEAEARMRGRRTEEAVGLPSMQLNLNGKTFEATAEASRCVGSHSWPGSSFRVFPLRYSSNASSASSATRS